MNVPSHRGEKWVACHPRPPPSHQLLVSRHSIFLPSRRVIQFSARLDCPSSSIVYSTVFILSTVLWTKLSMTLFSRRGWRIDISTKVMAYHFLAALHTPSASSLLWFLFFCPIEGNRDKIKCSKTGVNLLCAIYPWTALFYSILLLWQSESKLSAACVWIEFVEMHLFQGGEKKLELDLLQSPLQ